MERKIGEIFEYQGEWYQCLPEIQICVGCAFKNNTCKEIKGIRGECQSASRQTEGVIFKKLEKVGEPYDDCGTILQRFRIYTNVTNADTKGLELHIYSNNTIGIEIKQTKEDMEEKKQKLDDLVGLYTSAKITYKEFDEKLKTLYADKEECKSSLKEFDLEAAKAGKPVRTRDGRKARIICFDAKGDKPIIALVEMGTAETPNNYPIDGKAVSTKETSYDLMMLPEKKEGWINIYYEHDAPSHREASWVYDKEEEAIKVGKEHGSSYITTVRIEWEE